jgi:HD superfamily phosphohydrolase
MASSSPVKVGLFQTIEFPSASSVIIRDEIHGTHEISEPVLVELLQSPALRRLSGVCQAGISGLLGLTPPVTRFEHSVGAFLIVRKAGAELDEQIAGLLHDVSHTVLSHLMDWALSEPGESFHEVHKDRYVAKTELPSILKKHGYTDLKPLDEELYSLVEWPAPGLCADRLDYAMRDTVAFRKLELAEAHKILASISAFSDETSRFLVIKDEGLALSLARAYLLADKDVWSNPYHVDLSMRAGKIIGDMVRDGRIEEDKLWTLSDQEFWDALRAAAHPAELEEIKRIETEGLPESVPGLPKAAKVRTLDPDVCPPGTSQPLPLSRMSEVWAEEVENYRRSRQAIRV